MKCQGGKTQNDLLTPEILRMFRHRKRELDRPTVGKVVKLMNRKHNHSISHLFLSYLERGLFSKLKSKRAGQLMVRDSCEKSIRCHLASKVEFKYIIFWVFKEIYENVEHVKYDRIPDYSRYAFSFFLACHVGCGILVLQPGTEPVPPAVEAQHPSNRHSREFPDLPILRTMNAKEILDAIDKSLTMMPRTDMIVGT